MIKRSFCYGGLEIGAGKRLTVKNTDYKLVDVMVHCIELQQSEPLSVYFAG